MKEWFQKHWKKIWYMFCFFALGLIDQRRGSAIGEIQMIASNCTGLVMAALVIPTLDFSKFRSKVYAVWTPACLMLTGIFIVVGVKSIVVKYSGLYRGQWVMAVISVAVWSYLLIYLFRERASLEIGKRIRQPFFWCMAVMFFLCLFSAHESWQPMWYLMIYGGFYFIGIPEKNREEFFVGMLNGLIMWFFVQQIVAFGFRPYDFVRYRGMYSGETQNGIFYMIVYCAFLIKWIWCVEKKQSKLLAFLYFVLSAGCVSFLIFTGGRSSLLGAAVATLVIITWYDIVHRKRVYQWVLHGTALVLCIVLTIPVVYGCIRYLPTVLHHPIWFEGEYNDASSVRSFDPWNSERYISFEEALGTNLGRVFQIFGMKVHAAEMSEPGSSPDNPYILPGTNEEDSLSVRKTVYSYYTKHLNLQGHSKQKAGFYMNSETYFGHAHNMFLQMAYQYGVPVGLLFLGLCIYSVIQAVWKKNKYAFVWVTFLIAIFCYGMAEMAVVSGQITIVLVYIFFYFAGENSKELRVGGQISVHK